MDREIFGRIISFCVHPFPVATRRKKIREMTSTAPPIMKTGFQGMGL
jgi:hypothetical protein